MRNGTVEIGVSIKCPTFVLNGTLCGGSADPLNGPGSPASGQPVEYTYPPVALAGGGQLDVTMHMQWCNDGVLRKWATFEWNGVGDPPLLSEIVLERIPADKGAMQPCRVPPQSYPLFLPGFFAGIEYPVATTRIENGEGILAHAPGLRLQKGVRYESRRMVLGTAPMGQERDAFAAYIAKHYPYPKRLHLNYNSWWSTGVPYSEIDMLDLMATLKEKVVDPYGVKYDTFCIDLGWSDRHTIWDVNREKFPDGFTNLTKGAKSLGGAMGVWISPVSAYPEGLDNNWAKEQGYKTFPSTMGGEPYPLICMTDDRYRSELAARMVDMTQRSGVRHFKLDNYRFACSEPDHGHEPGELSAEALTAAIIKLFDEVRAACPEVWMESCAFGAFESPWWLYYVDCVLGEYGDDYSYGVIPCPYYHESYTTSRDFHNFQSLLLNATPARDQSMIGIVVQSPDPFMNDAVTATMRGNFFLASYVNPAYVDASQWKAYAGLLKWAMANEPALYETHVLMPQSMVDGTTQGVPGRDTLPRQPYGYSHAKGNRGLVHLRNPWITPQSYKLSLEKAGFDPTATDLNIVSLYPQVRRYGTALDGNGQIEIPLAPYETVVLSIGPDALPDSLPLCGDILRPRIGVTKAICEPAKADLSGAETLLEPNRTSPLAGVRSALTVAYESDIDTGDTRSRLLILIEDKQKVVDPNCRVWLDGVETPVTVSGSDTGWAAAGAPPLEHWLFLMADLKPGSNHVRVELLNRSETATAAGWVWATQPASTGETPDYPNALPAPEYLSLDATNLFGPIDLTAENLPIRTVARPVTMIDGVYLDALDASRLAPDAATLARTSTDAAHVTNIGKVDVEQAASFQRNLNMGGQPMTIFGRSYARGIGMQGPGKIAISVNGEFARFQSWVGLDGALNVWDESTLTFQVWADGDKKWESGKLKRNVAPEFVDADVSGAKTIELVVVKEPSQLGRTVSPWADWADARLLH